MESTRTVQTAFRFKPDMVRRMKNKARLEGKSLNSYVENLIMEDLGEGEERYEDIYGKIAGIRFSGEIGRETEECFRKYKVEFSEDEVVRDERLSYLLSK